jgi:hypothetical protein
MGEDRITPYLIPSNYTDSGLFLGVMKLRNAVEAALVMLLVAVPEFRYIHVDVTLKIAIMSVTVIPLVVFAIVGISGDSLSERLFLMIRYALSARKLHCRRVGYRYAKDQIRKKNKTAARLKALYSKYGF